MLWTENELEESSQCMFSQIVLALIGFVVDVLFNQAFFFFFNFPSSWEIDSQWKAFIIVKCPT